MDDVTADQAIAAVLEALPPGRVGATADDYEATPFYDGHIVGSIHRPHGGPSYLVVGDQVIQLIGPNADPDVAYDALSREQGRDAD